MWLVRCSMEECICSGLLVYRTDWTHRWVLACCQTCLHVVVLNFLLISWLIHCSACGLRLIRACLTSPCCCAYWFIECSLAFSTHSWIRPFIHISFHPAIFGLAFSLWGFGSRLWSPAWDSLCLVAPVDVLLQDVDLSFPCLLSQRVEGVYCSSRRFRFICFQGCSCDSWVGLRQELNNVRCVALLFASGSRLLMASGRSFEPHKHVSC